MDTVAIDCMYCLSRGYKLAISRSFYARQQNASRVLAMAWASVRPSVRLFLTLLYCIKTVQVELRNLHCGCHRAFIVIKFCVSA